MSDEIRILGIDPGSRVTGYGIVEITGALTRPIAWGSLVTDGAHSDRLRQIYDEIGRLMIEHQPDEIAIERVFVHKNADSALKLGQARAAALCATFGRPLPIHEYAAREVKKALTGSGAADKSQVETMVKVLLGLRDRMKSDAADALAVAICHAHSRMIQAYMPRAGSA